ncbi:hypothetical protein MGG_17038 [Pyricularia oryzae 70-15]|uniref:Uncharacterized protein n=3 Tax=Pyricularia oryzae TaxID=318829 RepID=G4N5X5_PYRO7|nr:uncharacterized protein MGG_17038 [Pyricularia oryzae 70-15]EHA49751.1 hypothetical protein MGG_17038 [Pyricularia oryzae 70-15]ELQ42396.1 hypothetical protein OOU_Y34scaffold00211g13 [Pyricularia oryzae Y34]
MFSPPPPPPQHAKRLLSKEDRHGRHKRPGHDGAGPAVGEQPKQELQVPPGAGDRGGAGADRGDGLEAQQAVGRGGDREALVQGQEHDGQDAELAQRDGGRVLRDDRDAVQRRVEVGRAAGGGCGAGVRHPVGAARGAAVVGVREQALGAAAASAARHCCVERVGFVCLFAGGGGVERVEMEGARREQRSKELWLGRCGKRMDEAIHTKWGIICGRQV